VLDVLRPGELGTRSEFTREWCGEQRTLEATPPSRTRKAFGSYLREQGIMIRRTRADVGRELPAV
jgi:hypothetical protein